MPFDLHPPSYWGDPIPLHWNDAICSWNLKYELKSSHHYNSKFSSQCGQDFIVFIINSLDVSSRSKPTFLDLGANDGHINSSTFSLESLGWEGLLVEPNIHLANEIIQNRNSPLISCAVGNEDKIGFLSSGQTTDGLGTIIEDSSTREWQRLHQETISKGEVLRKLPVPIVRLKSILNAFVEIYSRKISLLKIDVEGMELSIVKQLYEFATLRPNIVEVENNYRSSDVAQYLSAMNYKCAVVCDSFVEIWINSSLSKESLLKVLRQNLS